MVASDAQPGSATADAAGQTGQPANRHTVGGRFDLDTSRPLGAGGQCLVYRGQDRRTKADVAAKTLRPEYRGDPAMRARFRREARLLAFLSHPNIVRVEAFVEERDAFWVVLEFLGGSSVRAKIERHRCLPPDEIVPILDAAAAALAHIHARGLVHLDVSPDNLLATETGTIKLIDLGLAQPAGRPPDAMSGRTQAAAAYLSPEQACGDPVDAGSDLYALGCVVYELLTGRPPFVDPTGRQALNDLIAARLAGEPPPPSQTRPDLAIPPWVDDVLRWALTRDPGARYNDVETFARLFRDGVEGEVGDVPPPRPSPTDVAHRPVSRHDRQWLPGNQASAEPVGSNRPTHQPTSRRGAPHWPRILWAAVAVLLVANLVIGALLLVQRGSLPPFGGSVPELAAGATARVVGEGLVVRSEPALDAAPLGQLPAGTRLRLSGPAMSDGTRLWWPATMTLGDEEVTGYIPADWLAADDG
jgi:serine/threonine protein kinase